MDKIRNRTLEVLTGMVGEPISPRHLEKLARAAYADGTHRALLDLQERFAGENLTAFLRQYGAQFPSLNSERREEIIVVLRATVGLISLAIDQQIASIDADIKRM